MHPTQVLPRLTDSVTVTRDEIAAGRETLTTLAGPTDRERDAFLAQYLGRTLAVIAEHVTDPVARQLVSIALGTYAANDELHTEYLDYLAGFTYQRPTEDEPTSAQLPAGVVGFSLGRYTR